MTPLSVVVPVLDEGDNIERLLADLSAQSRAPDEIIIVDAGSRDGTREKVRAHRDPRIRLIELERGFPGAGRNAGLRAARSPWVAFVDAGIRVDSRWLASLMAPVDGGDEIDIVLGGFEPVVGNARARTAALAYVPARRTLPSGETWRGVFVASSAVRRAAAFAAGGFPEELRSSEDLFFLRRIMEGGRVAHAPGAIARWSHASGTRAVYRRFRAYAEHSLRAGLREDWFDVMARRYLLMALAGPLFPVAASALLLARAAVAQHRKPEFADDGAARFWQMLEVAACLGTIDAATFAAWIAWKKSGSPRVDTRGPLSPSELRDFHLVEGGDVAGA